MSDNYMPERLRLAPEGGRYYVDVTGYGGENGPDNVSREYVRADKCGPTRLEVERAMNEYARAPLHGEESPGEVKRRLLKALFPSEATR